MYCSKCRNIVEEEHNFCIMCGENVSQSKLGIINIVSDSELVKSQTYDNGIIVKYESLSMNGNVNTRSKSSKKGNSTNKCLVISLALLIVGAGMLMAYNPADDDDVNDPYTKQDPVFTYNDEKYGKMEFYGQGDFANKNFEISINEKDGRMIIVLQDDIASKYNRFTWTMVDYNHIAYVEGDWMPTEYKGQSLVKNEGKVYWTPSPGEYKLSVICYNTNNNDSETYSGEFKYTGNMEKEYEWTYDNKQFDIDLMFDYEVFSHYKDFNSDKRYLYNTNIGYDYLTKFVELDEVIEDLSDLLEAEYKAAYNLSEITLDQKYADYILTFVQICFEYPPLLGGLNGDEFMYGTPEYFVYPIETIFYGMGDCEDTSILCAALFKAAGFQAAIILVPGHALAGVALENYVPESFDPSFSVMKETVDGHTYYGCETTIDDGTLGIVGSEHSERIGQDHIVNNINRGKIGFYPIAS